MSNDLQVLKQTLNTPAMKDQIGKALPKHVPAETFIRTTMTVLSQNPALVKCERNSLMSSIMTCASLGLAPETFMGEVYIIPFKNKATVQVGYKGLLTLARRSGQIAAIDSGVCYENDEILLVLGDESKFEVKPCLDGDPGDPRLAWCVITLNDGSKQREIMSVKQIEDIRKASPSGNSPAWKSSWDAMARKVVIKRALKYAPRSTEMANAVEVDDGIYKDQIVSLQDGQLTVDQLPVDEPKAPAKRSKKLKQVAQAESAPVEDENPAPVDESADESAPQVLEGDLV